MEVNDKRPITSRDCRLSGVGSRKLPTGVKLSHVWIIQIAVGGLFESRPASSDASTANQVCLCRSVALSKPLLDWLEPKHASISMIIDLRTYTYLPSKFRKFLKGYQDIGFALTSKHLGQTLGVLRSESGVQNRTFQFFMYEDSDHRDRCRAGMLSDPAWAEFVKMDGDALLQQHNTLLVPTPYSPVGGLLQNGAPELAVDSATRLFELTTWTFWPDTADEAMQIMADGGATLLDRYSPNVILYATPDTGNRYQLLRLTAYANGASRDQARRAAATDVDLQALGAQLRRVVECVDETLLLPIACSPLR